MSNRSRSAVGDAAEVRHRHGEDDDRVGPLALDEPLEVPPPARRHEAPDRLARHAGRRASRRASPPSRRRWPSPFSRAASVAQPRVRLALEVGRVRRPPPPGRLDRPPAVRRDDELDALVVQRPARAATRRACSRSGSRGRPRRRRRGASARASRRIVAGSGYGAVKGRGSGLIRPGGRCLHGGRPRRAGRAGLADDAHVLASSRSSSATGP